MRFFIFFVMIAVAMVSSVLAISTSTFLTTTGDAEAFLSSEEKISETQSALLRAGDPDDPNEARVRIELNEDIVLDEIFNISWMQFVNLGYIAHVDLKIDTDGDGEEDDSLVFEYDKVRTPSDQTILEMNYSEEVWLNTFGDKGIVDEAAQAWLSSGAAGPITSEGFLNHTFDDWKAGQVENNKSINGATNVIAIEIEVDGWIEESSAFIDDVMINGELVEDFEGRQGGEGEVVPDFTFLPIPDPLQFGSLTPGSSSEALSGITVGASSLDIVGVSVTSITGTLFTEDNVLFSDDDGITFYDVTAFPVISIPPETSIELIVQMNVPIGTPSESFSGLITYTVVETPEGI